MLLVSRQKCLNQIEEGTVEAEEITFLGNTSKNIAKRETKWFYQTEERFVL